MSLYKRILTMVMAAAFVATSAMTSVTPVLAEVDARLPPAVELEKSSFDMLPSVTDTYTTTYTTQVNNLEERIQVIAFEEGIGDINGKIVVDIPEEIARVMHFFYRIDILGTNIKGLTVDVETPMASNSLSEPWRGDNHIQGRTESFKVDKNNLSEASYKGWTMTIEGTGNIREIRLFEQNGLPVSFDVTAYTVLGSDKPILDATLDVDLTDRLSIEGITHYEEEKFKNLYAAPLGSDDGYPSAEYYVDQNFVPGRQMFKFRDALEHAHWAGNLPLMGEDPNKTGYSDYNFLDEQYQRSESHITQFDALYDSDYGYVICYDNWPSWMWREDETFADGHRGTPDIKYFDSAAELAALYTKAYNEQVGGRKATWIEVKNESTITHEWGYHDSHEDSWGVLADFHNIVADAIRAENPGTLVGGPTAAWMALDANNFNEARNHFQFLDETKGKMDFYSYHFYEGSDLVLHDTDANYTGYLTGRLEADLDLLRNHMTLTDNVKPMVISETGTLHSGPTDHDLFIKLKNFNAYKIRYMNRANEFDIVVPFLLPITWWSKEATDNLMLYDANGNPGEYTKMKHYTDSWGEYNGKLAPSFANDVNVFSHVAVDGNVVYIAVNNMNAQRVNLDLNLELGDAEIEKIERTRMYLEYGEIMYEFNEEISNLNDLPMSVEETSILKITLNEAPVVDNTLLKTTYYGDKTIQPTGSDVSFTVKTPTADIDKSTLRVSVAKDGGFTEDLSVSINGTSFTHDLAYTNKSDRFFSYIDFEVPTSVLAESNQVVVNIPEAGGTVSTVSIINHYKKAAPSDEVIAAVSDSNMLLNGAPISLKAFNVDYTNYFDLDKFAEALVGSSKEFNITWNEDKLVHNIVPNATLTKVVRDAVNSNGDFRYVEPVTNVAVVDGAAIGDFAYEAQGIKYYKLRDICKALDIHVGWDDASAQISLDTSLPYSE